MLFYSNEVWLSLVEQYVRDVWAAGSNPVTSTIFFQANTPQGAEAACRIFCLFAFLGRPGARPGGGAPGPFAPVTARRIMPSLRGTYFIIEILSPLKNILNNFYIQNNFGLNLLTEKIR